MMKYGLCVNMDAEDRWGVGYERISSLKKLGYDYVELPLAQIVRMPEAVFAGEVLSRLRQNDMRYCACNNFFPAELRLTGPEADLGKIGNYVDMALARAASMGAAVVVMGSAGARNLPDGVSPSEGYRQLAEALGVIAPIARSHAIRIAIEPLNRLESNILNSYLSALYLAALSGQPGVGALVDAYHFQIGNEPLSDLAACPPTHVHYAELLGRGLPAQPSDAGRLFFAQLKAVGYDGLLSLEGYAGEDFERSAAKALEIVRA